MSAAPLRWRLGPGAYADLTLPEPLTEEHVRLLAMHVELLRETFDEAPADALIAEIVAARQGVSREAFAAACDQAGSDPADWNTRHESLPRLAAALRASS